jgi:hypothetical protein
MKAQGKTVGVWLDEDRRQKLLQIAEQAHVGLSSVLRVAVEIALEIAAQYPDNPFGALLDELVRLKKEVKDGA